jgi:hypothetical protein
VGAPLAARPVARDRARGASAAAEHGVIEAVEPALAGQHLAAGAGRAAEPGRHHVELMGIGGARQEGPRRWFSSGSTEHVA